MRKTKVVAQKKATQNNSDGMSIMLNYLQMEREIKIMKLQMQMIHDESMRYFFNNYNEGHQSVKNIMNLSEKHLQ